jgi:hypothetical protein
MITSGAIVFTFAVELARIAHLGNHVVTQIAEHQPQLARARLAVVDQHDAKRRLHGAKPRSTFVLLSARNVPVVYNAPRSTRSRHPVSVSQHSVSA